MKKLLLLPLMLFILAAPTAAQETPIDKMFRVMSMEEQMAGGFEAVLPLINQLTVKFNLNSEGKKELEEVLRTWFNDDIDRLKIITEMKKLYSQSFTDNEITKITNFYQTPVGKKYLTKSAQLMKTAASIGMQESQAKQPQLMKRLKHFLESHRTQQ